MDKLKKFIRDVPDFPKEWILFKDITPLLENQDAFAETVDIMAELVKDCDKIVGLDARWFLFAAAIAYKLKKPLVIVRKKWKLPYKTKDINYSLEYGEASFSIHVDSVKENEKIAIIDDLLATGGTMKAAVDLVESLGWKIHSLNFLIELKELNWMEKIKDYKINTLFNY